MMDLSRSPPMTLRLYGSARSRVSLPRWYLEEKGIAYEWIVLDSQAGEHRQPPFLAINPFGKMPALEDTALVGPDGGPLKLFESGAILLHLAELYGQEFSSAGSGDAATSAVRRALTAQWVLFANSTFTAALMGHASRPEELTRLLGVLDGLLGSGGSLLAGNGGDPGWGAADCALQGHLAYLPMFCPSVDLTPYPHVQAAIASTQQREAYRRVMGLA